MSSDVQRDAESARRIESMDDLLAYFRAGEKPVSRWLVGTEHEKIGIFEGTRERVPFDGERGIEAVLLRVAELDGWERVVEAGRVIALKKEGASITLEPGGQLELSGAPLRTMRETCAEFRAHVELVKRASEDLDIAWLALGADPFHDIADIPHMPKVRYEIMREYLPTRGELAMHMMHATATVQANYDYASEADMAHKLRTASGCSPIVSAIFANSGLSVGKENGYVSRRVEIWRHTDPDRCGILPFVFEPGFGYSDYAQWALDVPMFFLVRGDEYRPLRGVSFRRLLDEGVDGERATIGDWDLHLTTLFPEVRLKRFIEVRGADCVPPGMICALPALWKGVLYDAQALDAAWALVAHWSLEQREDALDQIGRRGLAAQVAGVPALELARELCGIAAAGLARIAERGESDADEGSFLDPVRECIEAGRSPGQTILDRWRGEWKGSADRLIQYARY